MPSFAFIINVLFILFSDEVVSQHRLASDVLSSHVITALDIKTLFNVAMCVNTEWSKAAARALSERTKFLTMDKMKTVVHRIRNIRNLDDTLLRILKCFAKCIKMRNDTIVKFRKSPSTNPVQIHANLTGGKAEYHIFKIKHNRYRPFRSTCFLISIDALIREQTEMCTNFTKKRMRKERIMTNIGSHPLIQMNASNIVLFASFNTKNEMHYHKRAEIKFALGTDQRIYGYDIGMYYDDEGHINVESPVPIMDMFAVDYHLLNNSHPCFCVNPQNSHQQYWTLENWYKYHPQLIRSESSCEFCIVQ